MTNGAVAGSTKRRFVTLRSGPEPAAGGGRR